MVPLAFTLVTGDDALAERVCAELIANGDMRVCVVSALGSERSEVFEQLGAAVVNRSPDSGEALHEAGVTSASTIITLSTNDEANLAVALRARMLNPRIRVVLRQFGTKIGRKIEQNLPDCSVISPAAHAASTYAGAALDPGCFFALRFPEPDSGTLVGFTSHSAADLGIGGMRVATAEDTIDARIVAVADCQMPAPNLTIAPGDDVVVFGSIVERRQPAAARSAAPARGMSTSADVLLRSVMHIDPILRTDVAGCAGVFTDCSCCSFASQSVRRGTRPSSTSRNWRPMPVSAMRRSPGSDWRSPLRSSRQ